MDIVVTNDRGLRDKNPAMRLRNELGMQIMSPSELLCFLAG